MSSYLSRAVWALAVTACTTEILEEEGPPIEAPDPSRLISWDEFRATRVLDGPRPGTFIVEGDILIRSEDELRRYYDHYRGARSNVSFFDGVDNTFHVARKLRLTYCISNNFTGDKAEVVEAMRIATLDWERATDVNFLYLPEWDHTCDPSTMPSEVYFAVRNDADIPGLLGQAPFPNYPPEERILYLTDQLLVKTDAEVLGTVRHELGHVLGLRHEHWLNPLGGCTEDDEGLGSRPLSPYDSTSVMHYDWCPEAVLGENNVLSRYDVTGVKNLYSLPRDRWLGMGPAYNHETDYNGDGHKDILWLSQTENPVIWYGLPGGAFNAAPWVVAVPNRPKPIIGLFDNNYRTDVLMYTQGTASDSLWLASGTSFTPSPLTIDGTYQPLVGDFDTDQNTDILWYRPGTDGEFLWAMGGGTYVSYELDLPVNGYYHPIVLDYTGDGLSDIFWYNPSATGGSTAWAAQGGPNFTKKAVDIVAAKLDLKGAPYQAIVGKFNADAHADIVWYRPGEATDALWYGAANTPAGNAVSLSISGTFKPFTGDFDGNGMTDIFWYAPGTAADAIWLFAANGTYTTVHFTVDRDYSPIVGDFDKDGDSDILWYRAEGPTSPLWLALGHGEFQTGNITTPVGAYPVGYGTTY